MWNIFQQNDKGYEIISSTKDEEMHHQRGNPYQYEKFANGGLDSRPESSLFDFERAEDDPHLAELEAKREKEMPR
ncbi:Oidioi.mRNA.OKI2018_I69.chr1.g2148.t1.cds [Oikopleura dioica]|uniref:Oidioi.mRNA.OKI2018_I69.chr1.g2148.t1.cds n=1 Tax=Oikopleura dioica TaxID=34765 RepID=A0ABN7SQR9_OIKDI|nr:Oidioi.mRNA.OKI2018_I69.chr1.g2148.t1.cds [Oikopleura dioica]